MNIIPIDVILESVCFHSGLTEKELFKSSRQRKYAWPRQMFHYLARRYSGKTFAAIGEVGEHYGGSKFDHATVLHSEETVSNMISINDKYMCDLHNRCYERIIFGGDSYKIGFVPNYVYLLQMCG